MKLTIIRLTAITQQDHIDLGKIWPDYRTGALQPDDTHRLYAARFNERLLGAVKVSLTGTDARLNALSVREITRRRGVGLYLINQVLADNPAVTCWEMDAAGVTDRLAMDAFMQAAGFKSVATGWIKNC